MRSFWAIGLGRFFSVGWKFLSIERYECPTSLAQMWPSQQVPMMPDHPVAVPAPPLPARDGEVG